MGTLSFRMAEIADTALLLEMSQALSAHDGTQADADRVLRGLQGLIGMPDRGQIWMIEQAAQPVGYLVLTWGYSLEFGGRDAFIDELFLLPEARGQGIGQATLQFAAEQCALAGVQALHLEVERGNQRAQAAYERAGFERREHYFLMTRYL
ncbi:MAG: GNAT family N-acetyltransferase [Roseiflexaceae bacterium]